MSGTGSQILCTVQLYKDLLYKVSYEKSCLGLKLCQAFREFYENDKGWIVLDYLTMWFLAQINSLMYIGWSCFECVLSSSCVRPDESDLGDCCILTPSAKYQRSIYKKLFKHQYFNTPPVVFVIFKCLTLQIFFISMLFMTIVVMHKVLNVI